MFLGFWSPDDQFIPTCELTTTASANHNKWLISLRFLLFTCSIYKNLSTFIKAAWHKRILKYSAKHKWTHVLNEVCYGWKLKKLFMKLWYIFAVQRPYLFLILQPSSATESYLLLKDTILKYQQKYCHGIRYNSKEA